MKKKKSRLIVSLLTAFIMAFTVFPYMGAAGQVSAETDPYVYDNSAKWNSFANNNVNLVKSIEYEPQSDGTFDATIDINTFACQQVIDGQDFVYFDGIGYSYKTSAESKTSYMYHDYYSSSTSYPYTVKDIVPGEQWTFWAWLSWDDMGQDPYLGCDFEKLTLTAPQLKPEDCSHSWSDATCTVAKKCKVCGTTSGSALGHTYTNACDTSCNKCGATRSITHNYAAATCTEAQKCSVCGATSGNALGHTYTNACDTSCNKCGATRSITHNYAAATCTEAQKCSVCGATSGNALGHTYTNACDTSCNRSGCTYTRTTTHSYSGGACTVCGAADPSAKVEEVSNKLVATKSGVKNEAGKRVILNGTVYLDSTVDSLELKCQITSSMSGSSTGTWDLKLYDPDGAEIDANYNDNPEKWEDEKFTKAGNYKYELEIEYTGVAELKYEIFMTVKKDILHTYKFKSLTAKPDSTGAVDINFGDFDSNAAPVDAALYRVSKGKIKLINAPGANKNFSSYGLVDYNAKEYSTDYTYYVMDRSRLSAANKSALSGVTSKEVTLTPAHKKALADSAVTKSKTFTTKALDVVDTKNLKVTKKYVKAVALNWGYANGDFLTGYKVQSYNSKGKLMATKYYKDGRVSGNKIYVTYAGTSKIKVTPYEDYKGKRYYGKSQTISATSAKIAAPGGHVTKISSKNARVVATKATGAAGLQVQQKVGKKWKTVTSGSKASTYKKTWTKNSAGKTSYRYRSYVKDQGKTYYSSWKTYKPKSNVGTYTKWSVSYVRSLHGWADVYFYPTKIQYKGSKIKVTGRFINTWYAAPDKGKFKVTFKVDGKSIGSKTITCKSIKANSAKTTTFYLSGAKKGKDLRSAGYSVKTYY